MAEITIVESSAGADSAPRLRMLFCAQPGCGHLYPLMPLAAAARAAGHDVVFATGEDFVPRLRALGFETHQVGIPFQQCKEELMAGQSWPPPDGSQRSSQGWEYLGNLFLGPLARRTAEDLLPLLDRLAPHLVIYGYFNFGAAVAATLAEVPAICHSLIRAMSAEIRQIFTGTRLEALWARYRKSSAPLDMYWGNTVYLDTYPPSLQEPSILENPFRIPMRPVPWSEPTAVMPAWMSTQSRALVYLTLGTVMIRSGDGLRAAAVGLSTLGVDVLVALGPHDPSVLGSVPAGVHVERFVHQADVLPHAELIVHHGGSGTTVGALSNGLPQLILPQGFDQLINAKVVASTGLGLSLEPDSVNPDSVIEAARLLLSDSSYRDAARSVRDEIAAMPHPMDVLPILASLAKTAA